MFLSLLAVPARPAGAQEAPPDTVAQPQADTVPEPAPDTLAAAPAAATPAAPTRRDRWRVAAELSLTDQSGVRDLRLFTGGIRVSHREKEAFELEGSLESRYGNSEGEVVARNHFGSLSFDLHPADVWSPFLFMTGERDPFKRLDLRFAGGAGAKYTPFQQGANEISLSLALLYSREDLRPSEAEPVPNDRSLARWSLRVRGGRELSEAVNVQHVTFYQPMVDQMADYLLRSETGAKVLLTERLALSLSYALNRTGRPPEGVAPEDRLFKTGLIIDF